MAHHRVVFAERRQQGRDRAADAVPIIRTGGYGIGHLGRIEGVGGKRISTGDQQSLQWKGIGEHKTGIRTQAVITARPKIAHSRTSTVLLAAIVNKGAISPTLQIEVPAHLIEMGGTRFITAHRGSEGGPEIAETLTRVTVFAADPSGHRHAGEILCFHGLGALQSEHHRRHCVFAVRCVTARPRFVLTIGNASFVDEIREEIRAAHDRRIDLRIDGNISRHQRLFSQHNPQIRDQSRRVHRAIPGNRAVQAAIRLPLRPAVAEGAILALALCQRRGVFVDAG